MIGRNSSVDAVEAGLGGGFLAGVLPDADDFPYLSVQGFALGQMSAIGSAHQGFLKQTSQPTPSQVLSFVSGRVAGQIFPDPVEAV
jgi:hypothetical protein